MTVLRHNDYQGEVEFDDGRLVIRILHIDDFITTEVDSASGAQAAFAELVDDYLISCADLGKEPCKPFKGSFNVRLAPKLHKAIALAAAEGGETLNAFVVAAIEEKLRAREYEQLSDEFARRMVSRVVHSQTGRISSQWQFVKFDDVLPIRAVNKGTSHLNVRGVSHLDVLDFMSRRGSYFGAREEEDGWIIGENK